jgi:hypothetical protein
MPARRSSHAGRIAALVGLLVSLSARAGGEFKAHGFTLPGGSVKVDDDRYRLAQAWDDVKRFYRSVYPPARFPRRVLTNQSGVRAENIENPGGGEWDGANIYESKGEVRVFILARRAEKKGKTVEEGEAPED